MNVTFSESPPLFVLLRGWALGAFGAHALKATLQTSGMLDAWNKAVLYHFLHALALVVFALPRRRESRGLRLS